MSKTCTLETCISYLSSFAFIAQIALDGLSTQKALSHPDGEGKVSHANALPGVTVQRETLICGADKTLACDGACQALLAFPCDARSGNANAKSDCARALLVRDGEGRDGQSVPNDSQI